MTSLPKPGRAWMARNMASGRRAIRPVAMLGALATLARVGVDDPSAYGLVRRNSDLSVRQFVE